LEGGLFVEAQLYRIASALVSVAGAVLVHASFSASNVPDLVAGRIGAIVSVAVGVGGVALVIAGIVAGSGLLRDFPGKGPPG
jgi:hypothetical protein